MKLIPFSKKNLADLSEFITSEQMYKLTSSIECKRLVAKIAEVYRSADSDSLTLTLTSYYKNEGKTLLGLACAYGLHIQLGLKVAFVKLDRELERSESIITKIPLKNSVIDLYQPELDSQLLKKDYSDFAILSQVDALSQNYDIVIVDTIAIEQNKHNNVDPLLAIKYTDSTILITSKKSLNDNILRRINEELVMQNVESKILGMVYNHVN
jgi:hypothetical protein